MDTASWTGLLVSLFGTPKLIAGFLGSIHWPALVLATLTPFLLLFARYEIRLRRLRAIQDFMVSFNFLNRDTKDKTGEQVSKFNPSCEFVKSKYISDIKISPDDYQKIRNMSDEDKLPRYIELAEKKFSSTSFRIYVSSIGFLIVSYFGFSAVMDAFGNNFTSIGEKSTTVLMRDQMQVVGGLAFIGAFIAATRMLLRCLAVFDLTAYTFLRQTAEMIFSILLVMLIYKAFPDPFFNIGNVLAGNETVVVLEKKPTPKPAPQEDAAKPAAPAVQGTAEKDSQEPTYVLASPPADKRSEIPWIWFALAPVLGLLPTSASKFLLIKMQTLISWIKTTDDRFVPVSKVLPLDIIDGIDFETRFLLEECGIYDVQQLATFNPVMLHIESSYGIYQCIDWISQAQLCHIVGPEKFVMFRELNIRTIFDLERAIDSRNSHDVFDDIYASILFAPTATLKKAAEISTFKFLITNDSGASRQVSVDEYCQWVRDKLSGNKGSDNSRQTADQSVLSPAIEYMMAWISDDLHVRRLRRLWMDIAESLGPESEFFKDSKRRTPPAAPPKTPDVPTDEGDG
jgi:hypothetical protein